MTTRSLAELGFKHNQIYEVVVSTHDHEGRPNAAPMGILVRPPRTLLVQPFRKSRTYLNLKTQGYGVANVTAEPEIFFRTAFKGVNKAKLISPRWFVRLRNIRVPIMRNADIAIEFAVTSQDDSKSERARFKCTAKKIHVRRALPRPYCRSDSATIECIIHATRVREFLARGWTDKANKLIDEINHHAKFIRRVSPNSENARMTDKLLAYIEKWGQENANPS